MYLLLLLVLILAAGYAVLFSRSVFILAYHSIGPIKTEIPGLVLPVEAFRRHLRFLKFMGFRAENLDTVVQQWIGGRRRGYPVLCITFDDGYRTILQNAAPVLQKMNWSATLFVPTGYIGGTNVWDRGQGVPEMPLLNLEELKKLSLMGIQIGSHGRTHRSMLKLSDEECMEELRGSLLDIDSQFPQGSRVFCYPFGHRSPRIYKMVENAGYAAACTLVRGAFSRDRYDLGRMIIQSDSVVRFAWDMAMYPLLSFARNVVRMVRE